MSEVLADTASPRRWPASLLFAAALVWLCIAAAIGFLGVQDFSRLANEPWRNVVMIAGSIVLQLVPPLAVALLSYVLLARTRPDETLRFTGIRQQHVAAAEAANWLSSQLNEFEAGIERITARLATMTSETGSAGAQLVSSASSIEAAGVALATSAADADRASQQLAAQLPAATAQADSLARLLGSTSDETTRQVSEVETMLAALWATADDAAARHDAAVVASEASLVRLSDAAVDIARDVGQTSEALKATVANTLGLADEALARSRAAVDSQTAALLGSVDQAQVALDDIGAAAARSIGERLDRLVQIADGLGARLTEQDSRSQAFVDAAERNYRVLDAKLGNATASGNAMLDALEGRIQSVRGSVHVLSEPLAGTQDTVLSIEAAIARIEQSAGAAVSALSTNLPAAALGLGDLEANIARVRDGSRALGDPLVETDASATRIAAALDSAHAMAAAINTEAGTAAITASSQLIEVLSRVREIANTTAGTMRETLGKVVEEAEDALHEAGTRRARSAFAAPIHAEIEQLEASAARAGEAAQGAAERVTQRLLGLTRTVATVEARIDEVDTRYDVALRDDISKRSEALLTSLQSAAIDITKLLSIDVGDDAWGAYLKGDKGIFARRAVRLIDRNTARQVARHFEHDKPFHEQAVRYITEFETLLQRVMPDREGKALAVTLLSSDVGKLYVVLAQATESLR